ncbi:MAG: glycosyltransferase family 4 protein [Candidatus Woesearchaeota archaeon]
MRLLIVADAFLPRWDGVSRFLSQLIPVLSKSFNVVVIAPNYGKPPHYKGVEVHFIQPVGFEINAYSPPRFATKLVEEEVSKAGLIFIHSIGPLGANAVVAANRLKKKVIAYVHSVEWELVPRSLPRSHVLRISSTVVSRSVAKSLYSKVNLLLVPSARIAGTLKKNGILTKSRIVPMGVDSKKFFPAKSKSKAKSGLGIDPNIFVIGFCGRIAREKDLPTLHNAFLQIYSQYSNCLLLLVGKGLQHLHELFRHEAVMLPGSIDNVLPYLQAMDVFCLPSLTETSSLATMEAMACGVPVIVTPVGGLTNYVKEGYNGLFFPVRDHIKLAEHIETLLLDKGLRQRLGRNARITAVSRLRWSGTTKKIVTILKKEAK